MPEPVDPLDRLYAYAAWMLGDRVAALATLRDVVARMPGAGFAAHFAELRRVVLAEAARHKGAPARERERLDDTLRLGTSISMKLGPTGLRSDLRRLPVLLTGFMQSCLIAVVQTLSPTQRDAFVLLFVFGLSEAEVVALHGMSPHTFSSVKARLLAGVEGYLGPRCGHLDARNPCQCPSRLQLALDQAFVQLPAHESPGEAYPAGVFSELRDLFAAVPPLRLAPEVRASLA